MSEERIIQEVPITLPCGCRIAKRIVGTEKQLAVEPCADGTSCKYIRYMMDEGTKQGKPTRVEEGRLR